MGGVIRREHVAATAGFAFQDVEREAGEMLARARAQAERLLADAEQRARESAEIHKRAAHQQGLDEGRQAGLKEVRKEARQAAVDAARKELTRLTHALGAGLAEYERNRRSLIALAETGLIELALAIARRVCKIEIAVSGEPVRANARALLELVQHHEDVELRLNPAEAELLADLADEFTNQTAALGHVTITADPAVARGDCSLRTRAGTIDASIAGQLDRIAAALCAPDPTPNPAAVEPVP
jgi:flagellar assembly protein FliH